MAQTTESCTYVGIDVSKHQLDLAYYSTKNKTLQVQNDEKGFGKVFSFLKGKDKPFCILESTGGYEIELAYYLIDQKIQFAIVNPKRVRDFAKALGKFAKTDKIDALTLAKYGETVKPDPFKPKYEEQLVLRKRVKRRSQLIEFRTIEKGHLENQKDPLIIKSIKDMIKNLTNEIKQLENEIMQLIDACPELKEIKNILVSYKGVGSISAAIFIAELPELGQLNRKQIAALAGLAPFNNDSGMMKGKRRIKGGRAVIRKILFMIYMSAASYNKSIQDFRNRLIKNGVDKTKIKGACMRKILVTLNSMVKNNKPWVENFA